MDKIQKEALRRLARTNFGAFIRYTFPNYSWNWHHRVLVSYLERNLSGEIPRLIVSIEPRAGKALAVGTPILTPDRGFVPIEALVEGDYVFGSDGEPVRVAGVSPLWEDRPCYRVTDPRSGLDLVADAEHEWVVRQDRRRPDHEVTRTTRELAESTNPRPPKVRLAPPLVLPPVDLPVPPYTMGVWLGSVEGLKEAGYGVSKDKRIPEVYFRASEAQRRDLLAGLIDSDGHVGPKGRIEFCSILPNLAHGVARLVRSLGGRAHVTEGEARLERERSRSRDAGHYLRFERVPNQTTVCIQVESDDHLFLAGEALVPTHNSELVSRRLPAYAFGRDPSAEVISATYGQRLSSDLSRDVQRIMADEPYREVFPEVHFDEKQASKFSTTAGGVYLATSVGGAMTGFGAGHLSIDDPVRGREDAESETIREKTWEWFNNDAMTRLIHPASVLVTATRWHTDDLTGRILSSPGAEDWVVLNIPSIAGEEIPAWDPRRPGDPVWPERYAGLGRDVPPEEAREIALKTYAGINERDAYLFSSLYQGSPTPSEGGMFKRDWFGLEYTADPVQRAKHCDEVLISVDAAFGEGRRSDPVELLVLGRKGRFIYVLDEINRRMDFPKTVRAVRELAQKWPKAALLIETKANGQAIVDTLRNSVHAVLEFNPGSTNKAGRAHSAAHRLEAGDIVFPTPIYAPWLSEFIEDFVGFGARPHDDRIDALSQACIHWNSRTNTGDRLAQANGGLTSLVDRIISEKRFGRF
jgi:predicted phage terminase large subunit-like protein